MDRIKELDRVLEHFYKKEPEQHGINFATKIHDTDIPELKGKLNVIIRKLKKDGYLEDLVINSDGTGGQGLISFEGGLLYESGGYMELHKKEKRKRRRAIIVDYGLISAGVGGVVILTTYFYKFFVYVFQVFFCSYF
ncbi:MAG: hypothetical protein A3K10_00710 [Bacteroidetes bacterium RIFCSPLOWO2_12_FULL_31_6]|nr:MAG: hypothetical protein A3K10_00710 [Bacteroidetes bacterium RIFCSPLOWO2_12_FULL_31_6]